MILMFVFPDLPAIGTRGQGSRGFAWEILCLPQWGAGRPSCSGKCYCLRARLRARPFIYVTQVLLLFGSFNAEESCFFCSNHLWWHCIWPMGVHWSRCWVGHLRFKNMPGEGCAAPQKWKFKGVSRALVWCLQCGVIFGGWRNCPCCCPDLKKCWGMGRANFWRQP